MTTRPLTKKTIPAYLSGRKTRIVCLLGLVVVLLFVIAIATIFGSVDVPLGTISRIIVNALPFVHLDQTWTDGLATIVLDIRLPRIIMAGLVGAALATAGATYQGLFRNPLADPYLIGVVA